MAATNSIDRVAASMGLLDELEPAFETAVDIPQGGVLFALPALLANGSAPACKKIFRLAQGLLSPGHPLPAAGLHGAGPIENGGSAAI